MPDSSTVAVLHVGQNGQVTIPADFRKEHSLSKGGKVMAIRMGDTLVMAPHDAVLESICLRLEEALKGSKSTVADVQRQALEERAAIVAERYGKGVSSRGRERKRTRSASRGAPSGRKSPR